MGLKDIAARMAAAKVSGGGNYIQDSTAGVLVIKSVEYKDDAGTSKKDEIGVFEFLVESAADGAPDKFCVDGAEKNKTWKAKPLSPPNKPGSSCAFLCEFTNQEDVAFSKLKGLLLAAAEESDESLNAEAVRLNAAGGKGHTAESVLAELYEAACGKDQPLRGVRVAFSTHRKLTKAGNVITVVKFEPVKGQTEEQIKAARAKLDGEAPAAAK